EVTLSFNEMNPYLRHYKEFLQTLTRFDRPGKLRNLSVEVTAINDAGRGRKMLDRAAELLKLVDRLQPLTTYLAEAQGSFATDHPWSERAVHVRERLVNEVRRLGRGEAATAERALLQELEQLKADYISEYARLHRQMVLNLDGDGRRAALLNNDPRHKALR